MEYETFQQNLADLRAFYEANEDRLNEATTRLQLIDGLLFDCLGWDRVDCIAEEAYGGEYTDYSLSAPHRLLIVEAKKEGLYFELPVGTNQFLYSIAFFKKSHPAVYDAIQQAIGYCVARGTPFGCVCNGNQIIAFLGSRTDGIPPLEGKALVFESLRSAHDEFLRFWQNLSKPGIQSHYLAGTLQARIPVSPPNKLSSRIGGYPGYKNRNDIQNDLQILGGLIIEDLIKSYNQVEFLRECYSESGAMSQYAAVNRRILETRYSAQFEKAAEAPTLAPLVTRDGVNPQALAQSISRRPILLLGDVGVGKTIFIQHLLNVTAADLIADAMLFYVDFGVNPTLSEELRPYLLSELSRQLLDKYQIDIEESNFVRGVYYGDIQRFKRSPYAYLAESDPKEFRAREAEMLIERIKDKETHLKASFEHLSKARRKQIIIILDNIDQRPYDFQQSVFLIAQSLAETWIGTVYASIRPETFYRSKTSGVLSAYHAKAFTISPPRIDRVIQKRLSYAIQVLERGEIPGLEGIGANLPTIQSYLLALERSFRRNEELIEFVDNIANGNVRLALDLIRTFVGSGHVDTTKITEIGGGYIVPLHEFLRAVIHGDQEYYDPARSELINVFDISSTDGREHFLCLILLAQLDRWGQAANTSGYASRSQLIEFAQSFGFDLSQINYAFQRLSNKKLIENDVKSDDEIGATSLFCRITSVGAFYFKRLIGMFAYVDPIIVDTPILDNAIREQITNAQAISERLDRAVIFYDYLLAQWVRFARSDLPTDFNVAYEMFMADIKRVSRLIGRQ
jgi:GTPase SAR1 family protein